MPHAEFFFFFFPLCADLIQPVAFILLTVPGPFTLLSLLTMADDTPAGITSLTDYRLLGNSGTRPHGDALWV